LRIFQLDPLDIDRSHACSIVTGISDPLQKVIIQNYVYGLDSLPKSSVAIERMSFFQRLPRKASDLPPPGKAPRHTDAAWYY
jgi:hypothetical protein